MQYPTIQQVEVADKEQLARWYRFLPSPSWSHVESPDFPNVLEKQVKILNLIIQRLGEAGGINHEISKKIGWQA